MKKSIMETLKIFKGIIGYMIISVIFYMIINNNSDLLKNDTVIIVYMGIIITIAAFKETNYVLDKDKETVHTYKEIVQKYKETCNNYEQIIMTNEEKYKDLLLKAQILAEHVKKQREGTNETSHPSDAIDSSSTNNKGMSLQDKVRDIVSKEKTPGHFRIYLPGDIKVTMKDVAGNEEVKDELKEIIDFLKYPQKYRDMGAKLPRGVLLQGPPGTGKTLLAKAVAGEANVKFLYQSGSDFVEKYVGVGAGRVRALFEEASKDNKPCIIFIDEIDAIGTSRNENDNSEKDNTLNELLTQMNGFEESSNVIVIGATNRRELLDSALLRPGRFDRQIYVGLPTYSERLEILKVHAKGKKFSKDFNLESLAGKTPSFSGAQLEAVLNEAALLAVRTNKKVITNEEAEEAIDRVLMGPAKKAREYIERERKIVAFHEAGHAVAGLKLENAKNVEKITIIPRGEAGGYNLFSDKEEAFFTTKQGILDEITGLLAGRAAEDIVFGDVTSGAANDLQRATELARRYVCDYGMSNLGLARIGNTSPYTSMQIDNEIQKIIEECYKKAKNLINTYQDLLNMIAEVLLDEETIDNKRIQEINTTF